MMISACYFYAHKDDLLWLEDDLRVQMKFMLVHCLACQLTCRLALCSAASSQEFPIRIRFRDMLES